MSSTHPQQSLCFPPLFSSSRFPFPVFTRQLTTQVSLVSSYPWNSRKKNSEKIQKSTELSFLSRSFNLWTPILIKMKGKTMRHFIPLFVLLFSEPFF
jgi:hypothetical protein